jgi:hypothetical protein
MPSKSYLRFFHALPIQYSIDIYIDDKLTFCDRLYEDFTDYIALLPGEHTIHITRTNNPIIIFSTTWDISDQIIYTGIIAPKTKEGIGIEIYKMEDVTRPIPSNNFLIRFGHFSMNTSSIDVFLSNDMATFKRVSCSELTNYTSLKPGIYTLQIIDSKTGKRLLTAPNIRLKPIRFYSIYMIGTGLKEFPLLSVISLDGNSYLKI